MSNAIATYAIPGVRLRYVSDKMPDRGAILETVALHFNLRLDEIKKKTRTEPIRLPRQIAMYLYRKRTKLSLRAIGEICGGHDHATVLNAIRKVEEMLETNYKSVREDISLLEQKLATL